MDLQVAATDTEQKHARTRAHGAFPIVREVSGDCFLTRAAVGRSRRRSLASPQPRRAPRLSGIPRAPLPARSLRRWGNPTSFRQPRRAVPMCPERASPSRSSLPGGLRDLGLRDPSGDSPDGGLSGGDLKCRDLVVHLGQLLGGGRSGPKLHE
jgi:hypothetical protein